MPFRAVTEGKRDRVIRLLSTFWSLSSSICSTHRSWFTDTTYPHLQKRQCEKKKKRGGQKVYFFFLRPRPNTCSHLFCLYAVGENPLTWPYRVHGGLYVMGLDVQQCAQIWLILLYMKKQA